MRKTTAARAADPETKPDTLLDLAVNHPEEVLSNPALPLIALEDPGAAADIRLAAADTLLQREVVEAIERATDDIRWAFVNSLIEAWELEWPRDRRSAWAARIVASEAAVEAMKGIPFAETDKAWRDERLRQLSLLRELSGEVTQ